MVVVDVSDNMHLSGVMIKHGRVRNATYCTLFTSEFHAGYFTYHLPRVDVAAIINVAQDVPFVNLLAVLVEQASELADGFWIYT